MDVKSFGIDFMCNYYSIESKRVPEKERLVSN